MRRTGGGVFGPGFFFPLPIGRYEYSGVRTGVSGVDCRAVKQMKGRAGISGSLCARAHGGRAAESSGVVVVVVVAPVLGRSHISFILLLLL